MLFSWVGSNQLHRAPWPLQSRELPQLEMEGASLCIRRSRTPMHPRATALTQMTNSLGPPKCYGETAINYQVDLKAGDGTSLFTSWQSGFTSWRDEGASCTSTPFDPLQGLEFTFQTIRKHVSTLIISHYWYDSKLQTNIMRSQIIRRGNGSKRP